MVSMKMRLYNPPESDGLASNHFFIPAVFFHQTTDNRQQTCAYVL